MFQEAPGFERRLSDLQAQIDRLTISLQLWRDGQERLTPADERLSRFADDVSEVLQEWNAIGERHARAVAALEQQVAAFSSVEGRLHQESSERFLALQRLIQQEWATLRQLEFEPVGDRRERAADLTEACVTATSAHAATISSATSDTERELESQLAQAIIRTGPASTSASAPAVVTAEAEGSPGTAAAAHEPEAIAAPNASDDAVSSETPRSVSLEYMASEETQALRAEMASRMADLRVLLREVEARAAVDREAQHSMNVKLWTVLCVVLAMAGVGAWWAAGVQRTLRATESRLAAVEADAARTAADAAEQMVAARAESARQAEAARRASTERDAMSAVLAAPDLIRYGLGPVDGSTASAQLLWSRSRGLVLSAMQLAPAPRGLTYQAWLLTESDPVSAGMLQVDANGRGTLVSVPPPVVRRPIVGVSITIEPASGSPTPIGRIVALNRVPKAIP